MLHECWWDAKLGCVRFEIVDELRPDEAHQLMDELAVFERQHHSKGLIVNHTRSPKALSRETRTVFEQRGHDADIAKLAFFGMNNLNRMIAQVAVSLLGRSQTTRFFSTQAEAEAWLIQ